MSDFSYTSYTEIRHPLLRTLLQVVTVGVVGGSDLNKITEQLGPDST